MKLEVNLQVRQDFCLHTYKCSCSTPAGEGLDFKAEVVNKQVQAWMPRGVPTGEDWLRVTRNLDVFEQVISEMVQI